VAEKIISLKNAAENSGYHPDYLGSLIRNGKLEGKKIGRNWFTTEKAVKDFMASQKFLPLKDFFLSLVKPRFVFIFLTVLIFIGGFFVFFHIPSVSYQRLSGDFTEQGFISSQFIEEETIKEVKITTYLLDGSEDAEVRAQLEFEPEDPEEKKSFFRQVINFFKDERK